MKLFFEGSCLIPQKEIEAKGKELLPYLNRLQLVARKNDYSEKESSINLPFDSSTVKKVKDLVSKTVTDRLKYVVVIGIGGSNLGTKAIYDTLFGYFDVVDRERFPKMVFLDTNDPEFMDHVMKLFRTLKKDEFLLNVISKSGGTTEPLANFETLIPYLGESKDRVVVTSSEGSAFYAESKAKGFYVLDLPSTVGGRYSVFSTVGLFPLGAIGADIDGLIEGAGQMRELCLGENVLENPAMVSAIILHRHFENGKNINDNFLFHPELESLGKWYRQLMGESVGKSDKAGITPTVSIGSTDLHSVAQLYLGGPKDKVTTFVSAASRVGAGVPKDMAYPSLSPQLAGKSLTQIMEAILKGTGVAYKNQQIPFMHISLDDLTEKSLGKYMQFKMVEMMFLGNLFGVDAFDQPHVELYKNETKRLLSAGQ